jgi:hypothetical protein
VPTFANRRTHVVSVTDPYGGILGFLDRVKRYLNYKSSHHRDKNVPVLKALLYEEIERYSSSLYISLSQTSRWGFK